VILSAYFKKQKEQRTVLCSFSINSYFLIASSQAVAVTLLTNNWLRHYQALSPGLFGNFGLLADNLRFQNIPLQASNRPWQTLK